MNPEDIVRRIADGIGVRINGSSPFDIQVHNPAAYGRIVADPSLGLGESYMEGWWDCEDLAELFHRISLHRLDRQLRPSATLLAQMVKARLFNLQSSGRAGIVATEHYDKTIDAYRAMTDRWITLSCAYWKDARTLDEAQAAKFDLIARKLQLSAAQRVLDIGCGFGAFARFAAERVGCSVVGINVSVEQARAARTLAESLPIEIHVCDYRQTSAYWNGRPFDAVVSTGMFEHVGWKNYRSYMATVSRVLKPGGLFLLHTVGSNTSSKMNDPWFDRYIFPNGVLPSITQIGAAIEGVFVMEDWHNFGVDYEKTLLAWHANFDQNWPGPRTDPFYRMWRYYLLAAAGMFRSREKQLWQIVLSKGGVRGGYASVR